MKKHKLVSFILCAVMVLSLNMVDVNATPTDKIIRVELDGVFIPFDTKPEISNGRVFVPLRAIFEALDCDVHWDSMNQTVVANNGNITLKIGSNSAKVNGVDKVLDSPAYISSGRVLVPVRFVAETLDTDATWNGDSKIVSLNRRKPVELNIKLDSFGQSYLGSFEHWRAKAPTKINFQIKTNIFGSIPFIDLLKNAGVYTKTKELDGYEYGVFTTNWKELDSDYTLSKMESVVNEITNDSMNALQKEQAIMKWINDNIYYDNSLTIAEGLNTFNLRRGVCNGKSELFISMLSFVGIPARLFTGNNHAWVLLQFDNYYTWVDPTVFDNYQWDDTRKPLERPISRVGPYVDLYKQVIQSYNGGADDFCPMGQFDVSVYDYNAKTLGYFTGDSSTRTLPLGKQFEAALSERKAYLEGLKAKINTEVTDPVKRAKLLEFK